MGIFYFDTTIRSYETKFQWQQALYYLERKYDEVKDLSLLYSLIGFSWYYLVEGPLISGAYDNDKDLTPLIIWKKYVDIGEKIALEDAFFNYIAGYTLSLHGLYISIDYARKGNEFMNRCLKITDNVFIKQLAENFIVNENKKSKKYIAINHGHEICKHLFDSTALIDQYFNAIFS